MKSFTQKISFLFMSLFLISSFASAEVKTSYQDISYEDFLKKYTTQVKDKDGNIEYVSKPNSKHTIIYVYADWCGFCKRQTPILQAFAEKHSEDVLILAIDATERPDVTDAFGFDAFPGIMILMKEDAGYVYSDTGLVQEAFLDQAIKLMNEEMNKKSSKIH